jgi:hypothetical protein
MDDAFFLALTPSGIKAEDVDVAYRNVRDLPDNSRYRSFVEKLWRQFAPVAEPDFRVRAVRSLQQAFWEMYLYAALREHFQNVTRTPGGGPDFLVTSDSKRIWVEAVCPTAGVGPDAVPEFPFGSREARRVPEEQILLRFTAALAEKNKQFERATRAVKVLPEDAYVVAINSRDVDPFYGGAIPYFLKAVLPMGHPAVSFDRATGQVLDQMITYRNFLLKVGGAMVRTDTFLAGAYPVVSALLHSRVDCANLPPYLGGDFAIVHNPRATVRIDDQAFAFARQHRVEEDGSSFSIREIPPTPNRE